MYKRNTQFNIMEVFKFIKPIKGDCDVLMRVIVSVPIK